MKAVSCYNELELPLDLEETVALKLPSTMPLRAWLDVLCREGWWYASLRLFLPGDVAGVNGFTDAWQGPAGCRVAAMRNAYWMGRSLAFLHGLKAAQELPVQCPFSCS